MPSQLILPLQTAPALGRADFLVAPGNAEAVAFIDSFPHWPTTAAALYGPPGSGKSHLVSAWSEASGAVIVEAADLDERFVQQLESGRAVAVENVDAAKGSSHEAPLFALFNRPEPLLLTGREPPASWPATLPDLASRFGALLAFSLWKPDDALLAALTRKLFTDRQLAVPDPVIMRILRSVERSPAAIRDFVARADARALAEKRPITAALVTELLADGGETPS
ncbi:MAG: chromosomal replication initiator DnaA [Rhizomicrobium sp.]